MSISITTIAMAAITVACAASLSSRSQAQQPTEPSFHAERIVRTGHLTFDAPVARVFPLFTPLGELHWAQGWNPKVLYPADGHPVEGLLFYTPDHDGTWWWLTRYDPEHAAIEYHVVSPAGLARNIRVQCTAKNAGTEVTVTDTYIGLNEHGNEFVRALDEAAYEKKMKGWEEPIRAYLKKSR